MAEIIDYLATHWVEWLFGACLAGLTVAWRYALSKLKQEHAKNEAIAEGVQCLLRESIVTNYNMYKDQGYCPIYAKESLKRLYHAYHDGLFGNDVASQLYQEMLDMPTEAPDGNRDQT